MPGVQALAAPFYIAAALLAVAGAAKVQRPSATVGALRSIGVRAGRRTVQALGAAEVAIGAGAIAIGGITGWAVGAAYLAFAVFVLVALRRGGAVASCGCFGTDDSPPTPVHVVLDTAAAGVGFAAAATGLGGITDVIADQAAWGIPFIGYVALGTWLAYLALSVLPTLPVREAHP